MSYFLYIASSLGLVICQTTLLPRLGFVGHFFDLLLPWVIYLAAFRPVHETLFFVLFMGALMDNLSGGPFGLYLISYIWLFIAVRLAASVVRAENPMVLVLILVTAVVFQNALFAMTLGISGVGVLSSGEVIRVVSEQVGWVMLVGPILALGMRSTRRLTTRHLKKAPAAPPALNR
jgi:rod shape-determining protein MreD